MFEVAISEHKNYEEGTGFCCAEIRTRSLFFQNIEDAKAEYEGQKERCRSVVEYAKRHKSTQTIDVFILLIDTDDIILDKQEYKYGG